MTASLKSYLICVVAKHVLEQGVEYAETYTEEKGAEIEAKVKELIPGEIFDAIGWEVVKALLPKIFVLAHELIQKMVAAACPVEESQIAMLAHKALSEA